MRASFPSLLLTALLWAGPAQALDWWVADEDEQRALDEALAALWPGADITSRPGLPPAGEDAVWYEAGALLLRHEGVTRRAEQVTDLATQVVLVRSWVEATPRLPAPPPPHPPATMPDPRAQRPLRAAHLLPGASGAEGLELGVGTAATATLDTDPIEGQARGYAPVLDLAAGLGPVQATVSAWNLWEPRRPNRPMGVAGLSVRVVDRARWRLAPWMGVAGGWKRSTVYGGDAGLGSPLAATAGVGPIGVVGLGAAVEVVGERLVWDLSLPLVGVGFWQAVEPPVLYSLAATLHSNQRETLLLLPFPEAGISWWLSDHDAMRFGLLAAVPSLRWRHEAGAAFWELSAATSVGIGQLGDGDLLVGAALRARVGVTL